MAQPKLNENQIDIDLSAYALANNTTLTGSPTAPTQTPGNDSTLIATTEFVQDAVAAGGSGLGDGQTWQDVTSSRVANVTYTNTTGRPIYISVYRSTSANDGHTINVDNVSIASNSNQFGDRVLYNTITVIVPDGSGYASNGGGGIQKWMELR